MQMLRMLGTKVADPQPVDFLGLPHLELWPRVAWSPLFACTFDDLQVLSHLHANLPAYGALPCTHVCAVAEIKAQQLVGCVVYCCWHHCTTAPPSRQPFLPSWLCGACRAFSQHGDQRLADALRVQACMYHLPSSHAGEGRRR